MLTYIYEKSKKQNIRTIFVGILVVILVFGTTYFLKIRRQLEARTPMVTGIITSYKDGGARNSYYYYTERGDRINSYYFFKEKNINNLSLGDSIYKAPDSFRLYIYKKDDQGKYIFSKLAMIYNDSISPYIELY